jgi:lipoyl(octanoyl) transferase
VYLQAVLFEQLTEIRDEEPLGAALNMALDEVLLAGSRSPLLRIYRWERPSVSFGYFGSYARVATAWPGREIVRRMTGGGIVPHGSDLTYSLIVPAKHAFSERTPRDVYRAVHETIAGALSGDVEALALAAPPEGEGSGMCFESPAEFDIITYGRKVAGAALRRTRIGLLLQGSIQELPGLELLRSRLASLFSAQVTTRNLSQDERAEAAVLSHGKYATEKWNSRV